MQNFPQKRYWEFQRLELPFLTTALPRSSLALPSLSPYSFLVPPSLLPYFHLVVHCSRRTSILLVPLLAFVILASYFCITLALPTLFPRSALILPSLFPRSYTLPLGCACSFCTRAIERRVGRQDQINSREIFRRQQNDAL